MAPDDYGLLQYDIEEIMEKMPRLCKDVQKVWDLLHTAYGKECFTPMIIKKFPNQFNVNLSSTNKQLNLIKGQIKREMETAISAISSELGPMME